MLEIIVHKALTRVCFLRQAMRQAVSDIQITSVNMPITKARARVIAELKRMNITGYIIHIPL